MDGINREGIVGMFDGRIRIKIVLTGQVVRSKPNRSKPYTIQE